MRWRAASVVSRNLGAHPTPPSLATLQVHVVRQHKKLEGEASSTHPCDYLSRSTYGRRPRRCWRGTSAVHDHRE